MPEYLRPLRRVSAILIIFCLTLGNCTVYTISKSDLENGLKSKPCTHCKKTGGLNMLTNMYYKQYINSLDTLQCLDALGQLRTKRLKYDSKITIHTKQNRTLKFYAKTLYIWRDEFLVGELTAPSFRGPNYRPVKLSDIASIEVKGY